MNEPIAINSRIIEGLYCEALLLSDEVRAAFDLSRSKGLRRKFDAPESDTARVALSCEALRTTTRMMHALAWLLNHRAFLAGELSEFQLRRYGGLPSDPAAGAMERDPLLTDETVRLVEATERFYARLARLDRDWREQHARDGGAVAALRERLGSALAD